MNKLFILAFVTALSAGCDNDSSEPAKGDNVNNNSIISEIESEMGLKLCDCLPEKMPLPGSKASPEERQSYQKEIEKCIELQSAIVDKIGHQGFGEAQAKCN